MTERSARLRLAWSLPAGTGPSAPGKNRQVPASDLPGRAKPGLLPKGGASLPGSDPASAQGSSPAGLRRRLSAATRHRARPRRGCASIQKSQLQARGPHARSIHTGHHRLIARRAIETSPGRNNRMPLARIVCIAAAVRARIRKRPPTVGSGRRRRIHNNHRRHRRARYIHRPGRRVARRRRWIWNTRPASSRA